MLSYKEETVKIDLREEILFPASYDEPRWLNLAFSRVTCLLMLGSGHSRPSRASSKFGYVRCGPKAPNCHRVLEIMQKCQSWSSNRARYRHNMAGAYCTLWTVLPKVISGLRKPIAIQAAISFNINLPEWLP